MSFDKGFKAKVLALLTLGLVFGSGVGLGLLWDRNLNASVPEEVRTEARDGERRTGSRSMLVEQVGLTEDQKSEIDVIVGESRRQMKALNEEFQPRYRAIIRETREDIKTLLTGEQRAQYDSLLAEFDARRDRHRDRDSDSNP
jgi:Spy/CpxP family protein refolding chaperone